MLPLVLVFPILSFSTDWVSRVQQITGRVLLFRDPRGRLRFSRPLPYATAIVAAALLTGEILAGAGLAGGLAAVLVITVIMIALIRLAGIGRHWPRKVATRWIFAGAAVFVIDFLVLVDFDPFPPGLAGPPVQHGRGARPGPAGAGRAAARRRVHPDGPGQAS